MDQLRYIVIRYVGMQG